MTNSTNKLVLTNNHHNSVYENPAKKVLVNSRNQQTKNNNKKMKNGSYSKETKNNFTINTTTNNFLRGSRRTGPADDCEDMNSLQNSTYNNRESSKTRNQNNIKMFQINEESEYKASPPKVTHGHSNSAFNCGTLANGAQQNNNYVIVNRGVNSKYSKKNGKYIRENTTNNNQPNEDDNIILDEELLNSHNGVHLPYINKNINSLETNNNLGNSLNINTSQAFHNNKSLYYTRMPNENMLKSQVYSCRGNTNIVIHQRRECSPEYYLKGKI